VRPYYPDAAADLQGRTVRVYWNFHRNLWSVQTWNNDVKGWRVHGYCDRIELLRLRFTVSLPGNQRVRKTRRKNVHAYVVGQVPKVGCRLKLKKPEQIRYNPYEMDQFQDLAGNTVTIARLGVMVGGKVWVTGKNML